MSQPKVLIVDDDADSRAVLRDVLGSELYNLLEASDGQQALQIAASELPDLILLDVMMPGMDGDLVLHNLKEDEKTCSIPVILVSALDLRDTQACVCLGNGAMDHICKPFSGTIVRSRVRAVLHCRTLSAGDRPRKR
jgi:DNA-binding response OmpR family regulator